MFGRDDLKEIREALQICGCDMNAFKRWQRKYEKLVKQMPSVREQYENALRTTQEVYVIAQELERLIVQNQIRERENMKDFSALLKDLKKVQNSFDHEFIISREDREFHSTYESILRLGTKALEDVQQKLILQSEIENLLALLKENLEKEEPRLEALCFFYQEHTDRELVELPPAERMNWIMGIYQQEFIDPIAGLLLENIPQADMLQEQLIKSSDRKDRREAELLKPLWNRPGEQLSSQMRAQRSIQELLEQMS